MLKELIFFGEIGNIRFVLSYFFVLCFNLLLTFLILRLGLDTDAGSTDSMAPFSSSDRFLRWKKGSLNKSAIC